MNTLDFLDSLVITFSVVWETYNDEYERDSQPPHFTDFNEYMPILIDSYSQISVHKWLTICVHAQAHTHTHTHMHKQITQLWNFSCVHHYLYNWRQGTAGSKWSQKLNSSKLLNFVLWRIIIFGSLPTQNFQSCQLYYSITITNKEDVNNSCFPSDWYFASSSNYTR